MYYLLAQAQDMDPIWNAIGNITAISAVIGLLIFLIIKALPAMMDKFVDATVSQRADFNAMLNKDRDSFTAALQQQRNDFKNELANYRELSMKAAEGGHRVVDHLAEQVTKLADKIDKVHPA